VTTVKILIADDEPMSRRLLTRTLERAGYEVIAVENGRLAVEQLCKPDGPRLALLDWMMPELDGPGVCREVRKRPDLPYIHIVMLTSKGSKEDIVAGLESGAADYVIKPWHPEELKARLQVGRRISELEDRLVEARETMRFKATHDPLTSLFNRGVIVDLLSRELARTHREAGCTTVLMCDLDHFKNVNDTYGHVVGDEVLREVARRLLGSTRSYDLVGRYGGEEFLLVLNNCGRAHSFTRAEEIRNAIATPPVQTTRGPLHMTISVGVLATKDWGHKPVEELLSQVDVALYAAKGAGRNCSKLARPATETSGPPRELLGSRSRRER
jgi:two-component system cell cycle response regulator